MNNDLIKIILRCCIFVAAVIVLLILIFSVVHKPLASARVRVEPPYQVVKLPPPIPLPQQAYSIIKKFEGLEMCGYIDGRAWRSGVGTIHTHKECLSSEEEAKRLYLSDSQTNLCEKQVSKLNLPTKKSIALFSLCYNRGWQAMRNNRLIVPINNGDDHTVCTKLITWHEDNSESIYYKGLKRRRYEEASMYGCEV